MEIRWGNPFEATGCAGYIDGHHAAFENRSFPLQEVFNHYSGYNTPELSKHRKRKVGNMSCDVLILHVDYGVSCHKLDATAEMVCPTRGHR